VGLPGAGVIESLTAANDGVPGINGQQAPTGTGTSSLAGLLRAYDATHLDGDGTYGHALQGASMYSAKGRWVSPATKSDGPDTSPDAIPQGSRLQLNPSFNPGYWGTDADWPSLAKVPLDHLRVVAPF
jgi:hypothetical protein